MLNFSHGWERQFIVITDHDCVELLHEERNVGVDIFLSPYVVIVIFTRVGNVSLIQREPFGFFQVLGVLGVVARKQIFALRVTSFHVVEVSRCGLLRRNLGANGSVIDVTNDQTVGLELKNTAVLPQEVTGEDEVHKDVADVAAKNTADTSDFDRDETVAIDYSSRSFGTQFQDLGDVVVVNFEFQRSRKVRGENGVGAT